jgi:hypothetical protein
MYCRALMMEAARTSETSANIQLRTWQYIPEDSELHTRCRENLKPHNIDLFVSYVNHNHKSSFFCSGHHRDPPYIVRHKNVI